MKIAAWILATIGLGIFIASAVIQLVGVLTGVPYEIPHAVFYCGALVGFVGFYLMDPKRAKDGTAFIVDQGLRVVGFLKTGRRSIDVAAIVEPEPPPAPRRSTSTPPAPPSAES